MSRDSDETVVANPAALAQPGSPRGHAAGLRTTILVTLAASIAMIQANILLSLDGKDAGSFAVMDVMRSPLGILTGVGFLGGGAILKKGRNSLYGTRNSHALGDGMDRCPHPPHASRHSGGDDGAGCAVKTPRSREPFDLTWKQAECAEPSLGFLAVVNRVSRTKSFELVSGGDH
jgi:hypothetical protein